MIFRWSKKYEVLFLTMCSEVGVKMPLYSLLCTKGRVPETFSTLSPMIMVFCKSVFFYFVPHESVLNSSVVGRIFVQVMVLASHRLVAQNYMENCQFIVLLLLSLAPAMCN